MDVLNDQRRNGAAVTEDYADEFRIFWKQHEHSALRGRDLILSFFCPQVSQT